MLRFKKRHGIRELAVQKECRRSDIQASVKFKEVFAKKMYKGGYISELIYNADVSECFRKINDHRSSIVDQKFLHQDGKCQSPRKNTL